MYTGERWYLVSTSNSTQACESSPNNTVSGTDSCGVQSNPSVIELCHTTTQTGVVYAMSHRRLASLSHAMSHAMSHAISHASLSHAMSHGRPALLLRRKKLSCCVTLAYRTSGRTDSLRDKSICVGMTSAKKQHTQMTQQP